jgi:serine/threonine protein kinase/tetratricopeptide (TPR) repeat protein
VADDDEPKLGELDSTLDETLRPPAMYGDTAKQVFPPATGSRESESSGELEFTPTCIAERYDVLGLLGQGGMGSVYRAHDRELDEIVALKFLRKELAGSAAMLERFRAEVRITRKITHANIARTFDIGEHQGEKFFTMEYVDGEPLSTTLAREGQLSWSRTIEIGLALCSGLAAAHDAGIIHRDLKPSNVLMGRDGRVVISDFGIAFSHGSDDNPGSRVMGTAAYMAPEQVEGRPDIDARADQYALGALLFEILTGKKPWRGDSVLAVATARLVALPPDPRSHRPDIPESLARIVVRCMAREPEARYVGAAQVAGALSGARTSLELAPRQGLGLPMDPVSRASRIAALPQESDPVIAVIPFQNIGSEDDGELVDDLTDELTDRLSAVKGLRVRPRRTVERSIADGRALHELGAALAVHVLVEGKVRRRGDQLRIHARALSVADDIQIWAQRVECPTREALRATDSLAGSLANALQASMPALHRSPMPTSAIELYLSARQLLRRRWSGLGDLAEVVAMFELGLAAAPDDPSMLAGYAMAVARGRNYAPFQGGLFPDGARAERAARRAISLAPGQGDPWLALATIHYVESDWMGASHALRRALAVAPGLATAHEMLASIEGEVGLAEESLTRFEALLATSLDAGGPRDSYYKVSSLLERWSEVDAHLAMHEPTDEAMQRDHAMIRTRCNAYRGKFQVPAHIELDMENGDNLVLTIGLYRCAIEQRSLPDAAIARFRRMSESTRVGSRLRPVLFQLQTEIFASVGRLDEAIAALGTATDSYLYDILWCDRCPLLTSIRSRPEFQEHRARVEERASQVRTVLLSALVDG